MPGKISNLNSLIKLVAMVSSAFDRAGRVRHFTKAQHPERNVSNYLCVYECMYVCMHLVCCMYA